ncbi:MAG: substrate-binding domain-containing protein, partial [Bacteroidota bacterium]
TVSQENSAREIRHVETLLSMRVDGLIVSVSEETKNFAIFQKVRKLGIPLTFMDRVVKMNGFNTVVADDQGGAFSATEQAINIGYKKIAHLGGYQFTSIGKERNRGFEAAMKQYGLPINPAWSVRGGFSESDGYRGFMSLYESGSLPECIFAVTYPVALGVYRAVEELGMKIPDDVDLICFGGGEMNKFLSPPLSYVHQPTAELGRKALELTLENIRRKEEFTIQNVKLPTSLVLYKTVTKKIAGSKKGKG